MNTLTKTENIEDHSMEIMMNDVEKMQGMARRLMNSKHYQKMGEDGIFAIVQKAKSIGINPLDALNGGMYYVQGKVEMQGQQMLSMIRSCGHSVTMLPQSTASHVFMKGIRKDNGDSWEVDFSIEDAKRAGIYRGQWEKYPKVMCVWRCVSMLGRFLFSDITKGVYVKGEIKGEDELDDLPDDIQIAPLPLEIKEKTISGYQALELSALLSQCSPAVSKNILEYIYKEYKIEVIHHLPLCEYEKYKELCSTKAAEYQKKLAEAEMNNVNSEEVLV